MKVFYFGDEVTFYDTFRRQTIEATIVDQFGYGILKLYLVRFGERGLESMWKWWWQLVKKP